MGVHNLWELLAPVGRRVSVETLAGKKLAIDASIWMIQFMKAMRDEKGEMVKNAHILGFFRRICKLLFLRTKPVFVFDGATPALKRRTVIARRRQRENAQAKIRKTAEKLLLNHLKTMRLKELAEDLENQRHKNDAKGKRKITDKADTDVQSSEGTETVAGSYNQEAIDELLAASLAAQDDDRQMNHTSTSAGGSHYEEQDGEEDEEMILPTMHGKVDPAVLAALPPSMQLDLLVQMRESLMAENRQKYQKVKKAPERFSELQIQTYLKTVAFRRDIDEVRKSAAGRGIGGVQTSRIASEANREFIFSSSFTGDKHILASAGVDQSSIAQRQVPSAPPDASDSSVPTKKSNAVGSVVDQSSNTIDDDVETYLDERGRVRVSRVRAMGLRMTRDLQRNLDLMKESELESSDTTQNTRNMSMLNESISDVSNKVPSKIQLRETLDQSNDEPVINNRNEDLVNLNGTPIEVSFDDNGENRDDDDLFTRLVAGDSDLGFVSDEKLLKSQSSDSVSDCDWEEGVVGEKSITQNHTVEVGTYPSITESREIDLEWVEGLSDLNGQGSACPSYYKEIDAVGGDESNVEWEDGSSDIPGHAFSCQPIYKEAPSKGAIEEEMNFQEAIRRSLEDSRCEKHIDVTSENENLIKDREMVNDRLHLGLVHHVKDRVQPKVSAENVLQPIDSEVSRGGQRLNNVSESDILKTNDSLSIQSEQFVHVDSDNAVMVIDRVDDTQNIHMLCEQGECVELTTPAEDNEVDLVTKKSSHSSSQIGQLHSGKSCTPAIASHSSESLSVDLRVTVDDARPSELETHAKEHSEEVIKSSDKESFDNTTLQRFTEVDNGDMVKNRDDLTDNSVIIDSIEEQVEKAKANLEEEMQRLGKERTTLGDEQRNLERNAEAVSSEMFAECQELLQMFGLPYIIAPMEAEAQCAFMELENLVDGVVTDDSDVFLFGARSVYKNIFDDRKYVETYLMKDIENELGLTREKLMRMALLLGSDYTEGVSGIGIVNAIEVINAFPEEDGLHQFREWIESPDPSILGKVNFPAGSSMGKKASKAVDCIRSSSNSSAEDAVPVPDKDSPDADLLKMKQQFMDKHRNVSKNWHIPSTFPSEAVITEYSSPQVDKSTETFSWGKPDLFVLRKLCWEKFGWGTQKADDLLVPVLKEYNKHETQLRLEAFYTFNERFAKIRSKRIKKAVKGTSGNHSSELMDDTVQDIPEGKKRRKKMDSSQAGLGEHSVTDGNVAGHEINSQEAPTASQSKRSINGEPCIPGGNTRGSTSRGRGRGGRGRGRGRSVKQGRSKESSGLEYGESSSDEENDNDSQQDLPDENYDRSNELRRSTRPRKAVSYTMNNIDIDDLATTNQDSGDSAGGEIELLGSSGSGTAFGVGTTESQQYNFDPLLVENCTDDLKRIGASNKAELNIGKDQIFDENLNTDQDYLRMGGGFCTEDDEVDKDTRESAYSSANIISDNDNRSAFREETEADIKYDAREETEADIKYDASQSVLNSRTVEETRSGRHTDTPSDMENQSNPNVTDTITKNDSGIMYDKIEEGDNTGVKSGRFLSAMPNLRRKRRRS